MSSLKKQTSKRPGFRSEERIPVLNIFLCISTHVQGSNGLAYSSRDTRLIETYKCTTEATLRVIQVDRFLRILCKEPNLDTLQVDDNCFILLF